MAERAVASHGRETLLQAWVPEFIAAKYPDRATQARPDGGTRRRFLTAWRTLRIWLDEMDITRASQITREQCRAYPAWRQQPDKRKGKYRAGRNTALMELKFLSMVLTEAMERKQIPANPALRLGLKPDPRRLRPEFSDEELKKIVREIKHEHEPARTMLRNSFLIARWHGVRLNETRVNPMTDVWAQEVGGRKRWMILFRQKGGREEPKILHPKLIPLFNKLRTAKATRTYADLPWGNRWHKFLKRIGISIASPNACFHSLRITAASRLARANVAERKAMEYLTHASTTVHASYVRWQPKDMEECHHAL